MTLADMARHVHLQNLHGEQRRVIADVVTVKATAEDTADAYSLFEVETPPSGGFPAHIQRHVDNSFYVVEGTYTFLVGDQQLDLATGAFILIPRGIVHAYANLGSTTARMLVFVTPGGIQEQFVDEIGDRVDRPAWEPDMSRILAVAPKYGIEFADFGAFDH